MNYKKIVSSKKIRFKILSMFGWIPDKIWLKFLFRVKMGYWMDFRNPRTFNEKLQWLKIYDYKESYAKIVDKYSVKKFVTQKIGDKYVIPTIGVWNRPSEIDWSLLPDRFVLKTTDGGGNNGVVICRDKNKFDINNAIKKLSGSSVLTGAAFREHPYDNVKKRIIAEELLVNNKSIESDIIDYKFFCFHGEPKFLYTSDTQNHKLQFLNLDWTAASFSRSDYDLYDSMPSKPEKFDEMVEIARILSKDFLHIRVDLYNVNNRIYFGELTFYTCGGFIPFTSLEDDIKIGNYLTLPI